MKYRGAKAKEISFPLGGIGAGCIGIAGDGRLIDWEIFNKPNKNSLNGFSHFAVKAECGGTVLDTRVLAGRLSSPYMGGIAGNHSHGFGFGPNRASMAGLPNFSSVEFSGEYPSAELTFRDKKFPGTVTMTAWSPFIPLNDRDSSIPASFFDIAVTNTGKKTIVYTVACTVRNPLPEGTVNRYAAHDGISSIRCASTKYASDEVAFGDITMATDAKDTSYQEYWYRGAWFDNLGIYWQDISRYGTLKNRAYDTPAKDDHATLAARITVAPGKTEHVRYVITWNFPNCTNYWSPEKCACEGDCKEQKPRTWKNYYATVFEDSSASALYAMKEWHRLFDETMLFKNALFRSTLPPAVIDAVSANISILKSPTCVRLENGEFYGWEGCYGNAGCCEGSCTHVWNYAYALPFLFPKLERSMRDLNYRYNQRDDGGLVFRIKLPLGRDRGTMRPCADGQFGDVIKTYRDWKICGDTEWLRGLWPSVKKSIEFAWAPTNADKWDADKDGVLEGRQHHTLDMELFGPNSWLTGMYLGALKAGSEMAAAVGESASAEEYAALFEKGRSWVDANLFNGKWYHQRLDLGDRSMLAPYSEGGGSLGGGKTVFDTYWNDEHKEIKYQIGEGSSIDQLLGQWHANLCGLGELFDKKQRTTALRSIFRHNYKRSFADFVNPCRLYSLYDEKGVVICDWPDGVRKPVVPAPYSEETMYGFEYAVASHMIQEGLVDEGVEIATEVRKKFDGEKRNPWNEFECGSNYARSMASYALLNAMSGFEYDMTKGMIGFSPAVKGKFRTFWSLDGAWGTAEISPKALTITVLYGSLSLSIIRSSVLRTMKAVRVRVAGAAVSFTDGPGCVTLSASAAVSAAETCEIRLSEH